MASEQIIGSFFIVFLSLGIHTPSSRNTRRTGVKELTSTKVLQKNSYVISITTSITIYITITGADMSTGIVKGTPSKVS